MRDDGQAARATRSVALEGLAAAALSVPGAGLPPLTSALGRLDQTQLGEWLERWPEAVELAFKMLDLSLVGAEAREQLALTEESAELVARTDEFLAENADVTEEAAENRLAAHAELRLGLERGVFLGAPLDTFVVEQMLDPPWPGLEAAAAATLAEQLRILAYPALAAILDAPSLCAFRLLVTVLSEQLWAVASESAIPTVVPAREGLWVELARPDSILDTYLRAASRPRSGMVRRNRPAASFEVDETGTESIEVDVLDEDDQPIATFSVGTNVAEVEWPVPDQAQKTSRMHEALHWLAMACVIVATALFLVGLAMFIR